MPGDDPFLIEKLATFFLIAFPLILSGLAGRREYFKQIEEGKLKKDSGLKIFKKVVITSNAICFAELVGIVVLYDKEGYSFFLAPVIVLGSLIWGAIVSQAARFFHIDS